jgi:sialate O-acetylesterase
VDGWRKAFRNERMPFLVVMLEPNAAYTPRNATPAQRSRMCDNVWLGQMQVADDTPGVHAIPIHDTVTPEKEKRYFRTPAHKMRVGLRVAENALKHFYGRDTRAGGVRFAGAKRDGSKVVVSFKGAVQGLESRGGGELDSFELSADNVTFVAARAAIEGDRVVVTADGVPSPAYVRMGWRNDARPLLQDRNGVPAYPFPAQRVK